MADGRGGPDDRLEALAITIMLTWSQLGHASPKQSDLVRLARSAPRDQLLRGLTMVATVLLNADNKAGGHSSPAHLAMAHALLKNDLWETANAGFQRRQWQVFLSPEGYLLAIRAVVRFGKPRVAAPAALGDVLGELILTANDLLDPGRSEVDIVGRVLRLWWFARQDQARYALARYYSLLTANPDPSSANYIDLDATFQAAAGGLSIREFVASAMFLYAMYSRYELPPDIERHGFGNEWRTLAKRSRDHNKVFALQRLVLRSVPQVARELRAAEPEFVYGYGELKPFLRAPFLKLSDGGVVPIWMPLLRDLAAEGPRWVLAEHLSRTAGTNAIKKLNAYLGARFEEQTVTLLRRCYLAQGPLRVLFPAEEYGTADEPKEGTDAVLTIGDAAVFFEMTITAPPAAALWSSSTVAFRKFLRGSLRQKLGKLEACVRDYLDGRMTYLGPKPTYVRRVFPLLVTLQAYPANPVLSGLYSEVLEGFPLLSGSQLGDTGVRGLRFVTIEELEMLEGVLSAGQADLVALLDEWCLTHPTGAVPFKNFLLLVKRFQEIPSSVLKEQFDQTARDMTSEIARLFQLDEAT